MSDHITASPLTWPHGWKREKQNIAASFKKKGSDKWFKPVTIAHAASFVIDELRKMGIPSYMVIISTNLKLRRDGLPYSNQKEPDDKGVAVWFREYKDGSLQQVIALDKYNRISDNLYAIGKTIEAMRGIERWGGGEILNRTFTGFVALPSSVSDWRTILNCPSAEKICEVEEAYKRARKEAHPDKGGSEERFHQVNKAWEDAQKELI